MSARQVSIKKTDVEQQLVFAEVYAPQLIDSHDDFMTAETIRNMAYEFMRKGLTDAIDTNHDREKNGSYIVESFIAREDDTIFIPGSWVIGVKVSDAVWPLVKSGDINGFSLDGDGIRNDGTIEMNVPPFLTGLTDEGSDPAYPHTHEFVVEFNQEGKFIGGKTTPSIDGHWHEIIQGTSTEDANGHSHRFSYVEGIIDANESSS